MNENSKHLIYRLGWDTKFDSKNRAVELQERLSDWTGFHLQKEVAKVFDKLCPPEQTWRIQQLELDLGMIDFNNLEQELHLKFRVQLNEKLTELLLYSHQHRQQIEILDENKSAIDLIRYFLQHGLLQWNYQSADGSINHILTAQLQDNRDELITMLKETGFKAEQFRQRLAWQVSEPNMIKIIGAMEPNAGGQILLLINMLTIVQQKETVVQVASTSDFKKNLWFWVLNYLLTERGTVFNRIQFMKSSITQMAAHYNMQYDQLFEVIECAVTKLSRSLSLQPDFILTLQLLAKENKRKKKTKLSSVKSDIVQHMELQQNEQQQEPSEFSVMLENKELVKEMMTKDPEQFLELLKKEQLTENRLRLLGKTVDIIGLLKLIGNRHLAQQSILEILGQFYRELGTVSISGISGDEMQFILFHKIIRAWTTGNWKLIATSNIWKELIWEVGTKKTGSKNEFLNRMHQSRLRFPPVLRLSLESVIQQDLLSGAANQHTALTPKVNSPLLQDEQQLLKGAVSVRNAGIVLINGYLSVLLSRLGLISEQKKFISKEDQLAAVHYLQYAVTGLEHTEESFLPLNKLLCGIPLSQPVMEGITLSVPHKELIDGLITAVIDHWPAIGKCSVEGFRGNWLVRDGLLVEKEDRWELTVEKRAYDLLIHKSPFSFSVVRFPWMEKPLHVIWPY